MNGGHLHSIVCAFAAFVCLVSPRAGNVLHYVIEENQPASIVIGNVMIDANLTLAFHTELPRFSVLRGAGTDYVTVNQTSGVLRSTTSLDREGICIDADDVNCVFSVDVVVTSATYFDVIRVRITVSDVNDNSPKFPQQEINLRIPESAAVGSGFDIPVARDPDAGINGIRTYNIVPDRTPFRAMITETEFGPSLQLVVIKQLDRETRDTYSLIVVAIDGGDVPLSGTIRIRIKIQDANDNIPHFEKNMYTVDVTENVCLSSPIFTISASDPDLGEFGRIRYGLSDVTYTIYGDIFGINETNGDITLERSLDYETEMTFRLTVTAIDGGGNVPGRAAVIINVIDVNDNDPVVTFTVFTTSGSATVSKSATSGTFVAHLSAVDADSKENGVVSCFIVPSNEPDNAFSLRPIQPHQYKLVTTAALNSTNQTLHSVCVICSDSGKPQRSASSCLNVSVFDANANRPRFSKPSYFVSIAENNRIGAFLLRVRAFSDDGVSGVTEYIITPDNETERCFALDAASGIIRANTAFDYEQKRQYEFKVRATAGAAKANFAEVDVIVYVVNRNDEAPLFDALAYVFTVVENVPLNTSVGRVIASDADADPFNVIEYVIVSSANNSFRIDPESGVLSTIQMLDREAQDEYVIGIVAYNMELKSETAVIKISVLDVNDNTPMITYPARSNNAVYLTLDPPVGTTVCRLVARDDDVGENANLTFAITQSKGLFRVDRFSGIITTAARMRSDIFWIRVSVNDQGTPAMTSTAVLVVKLRTSGQRSVAEVDGTSGAGGITAIVVGVVCFLVVCLGVFVASRMIVSGRLACRQKCDNRGRVQYTCDDDDTILSAYSIGDHVIDTSSCQVISGVVAEVPKLPRPGILRHPSKVRFADTDAASETSRDVPSIDSGCCHSDETTMTSHMLACNETGYRLGTPRRLAEKRLTISPANVLHSTPVNCYCPRLGYSYCQCGLTPEFRHIFAESFQEPVRVGLDIYGNSIEPAVLWHRADIDLESAVADIRYRSNEDMITERERSDTTTLPSSQRQSSPTAAGESSTGEQNSSNSSSVIL